MSDKEADILRLARERFQAGIDGDLDNRKRDEEDRMFFKGGEAQWESDVRTARVGRPTMTINRLPQFVKQVTGEMRQNKPAIKVLPVDDKTDPKLADVYSAIVRHIESGSDAHRIYSKAAEQAVVGGIGWFRILTDYLDDTSFEQEIIVKPVRNPMSVVFDPDARELTKQDMNWAFVTELVSTEKFKKEHPKAKLDGFESSDETYSQWMRGEFIRVAEYWCRKPKKRTLALFDDGSTRFMEKGDEELMAAAGIVPKATREVESHSVHWYRMTGAEIIDQGEWKGRWIPLIPVIGEEVEVGDEVFRHGLIHHSKDAQRSYNFARSAMVEHVGMQPKAPYLVTAKQIMNYKKDWEGLNTGNPPVLIYDADPLAPGPPQRVQPPTFAAAWYQEAEIADQDMKATTGIYDASLGKGSNETSGIAIQRREAQGDTATFVYIDNLSAAIRQAGQILIDLIPHIYSDERVIRMVGEDGSIEEYAKINSRLPDGSTFNDISAGRYDVEVTTGPAFATKRQEAADKMLQLAQSVPAVGQLGPDMLVRALDMPYGDKLADRLQFSIPPGIDAEVDKRRAEMKAEMEQQQGPPQPDPMQMAQQQAMQIDMATKEAEAREAAANAQRAEAEAMRAMIEVQALESGADPKIDLMREEIGAKLQLQTEQQAHTNLLAEQDQAHRHRMAERKADLEERLASQRASVEAQMAGRRAEREDFTASQNAQPQDSREG